MSSREIVVLVLVAAGVVVVGMIFLGLLWGIGGMWGVTMPMGTPGMMGGFPFWGLLLFCLAPLLLGVLVIGGVVWLIASRDSGRQEVRATQETCPNCGEPVQGTWNNCPNCGQSLRSV